MIIQNINYTNCCPHNINIEDNSGRIWTIPEDRNNIIRIRTIMTRKSLGNFISDRIDAQIIENLPPYKENNYYIVSNPVAQVIRAANIDRDDFRALGKKRFDSNIGEYREGFVEV